MRDNICNILDIACDSRFRRKRLPGYCSYENEKAEMTGRGVPATILIEFEKLIKYKDFSSLMKRCDSVVIRGFDRFGEKGKRVIFNMFSGELCGGYDGREEYIILT